MSIKKLVEFTSRPLCLLAFLCLLPMMLLGRFPERIPVPAEGEYVTLEGQVKAMALRDGFSGQSLEIRLENVICKMAVQAGSETKVAPVIGEKIRVKGKVKYFPKATNPGEFDLREYQQINHLYYTIEEVQILARSGQVSPWKQKAYEIRKRMESMLEESFDAETAGILKAMLLGDKMDLTKDTKKQYQESGMIHVLAISGLHISIIGMALYSLLRKVRVPTWLAGTCCTVLMLFYGELTGMGVSTKRALVMFLIRLLGDILRRSYDLLSAMSLILIWMLFENPLLVKHSGFLLSYGAILALGLFYPAVRRYFPQNAVTKVLVPALVLFLVQMPILVWFQYAINPLSILLNLVVVPLMTVVVLDGLAVILVSAVGLTFLGPVIGMVDRLLLQGFGLLSQLGAARRPVLGRMVVGRSELWQIILYYVLLVLLVFFLDRVPRISIHLGLVAMCTILLVRPLGVLRFTMLDVGQGDGMILQSAAGHTYLFDGGSSSKSKVGSKVLLPALQYMGDLSLEGIFLSHPDEDHISGALELLELAGQEEVEVKCLILSEAKSSEGSPWQEVLEKAAEAGVPVQYIYAGQTVQERGLELICLGPERGTGPEEANELSEVFLLRTKRLEILLTGDTVGTAEEQALERLYTIEAQQESGPDFVWVRKRRPFRVLKVAHHGSRYSTPQGLLTRWKPDVALISCGKKNSYGHPHAELLERLQRAGIALRRTDVEGAISIKESSRIGARGPES